MIDCKPLPIEGLFLCESNQIDDNRGSFSRLFCRNEMEVSSGGIHIKQINTSKNKQKGTIRGMHYQQPPYGEVKIVQCLSGRVFDVAVDVRLGSSTFMQYYAVELSGEDNKAIIIPKGFAHGFQTLQDNTQLLYFHSEFYVPNSDTGLNPFDEKIDINWPMPVSVISDKDKNASMLGDGFKGIKL
jgi:dTDP-4-dehydrorhamnose 3,5-epimerase